MSTAILRPDEASGTGAAAGGARTAAIDAAIDLYRRRGIHEVSIADVARAAGLGLAAVQEHFPTIDDLLPVTIAVWHDRRNAPLAPVATRLGAVAFLRAVVVANVEEPALMRLLMAAASIAATPGHPIAPVLQQQWVQFHALVQRSLAHDVTIGREPASMEPVWGAEQLIAVYEGLQVQSLLRPHMDLLASYDRAVARLRDGWASSRSLPVWQL